MNPIAHSSLANSVLCLSPDSVAALLEHSLDLVALVEMPEWRLRALNTSGCGLLMISPRDDVVGQPWQDFVAPSTWQVMSTRAAAAIAAGRNWRGDGLLRSRRGDEMPVLLTISPLGAKGAPGGCAVITAVDDSRFHHMQTVLRHEQLLLHAMFSTVPDAIYFKDRESRFIRGSAALAQRMGANSPEELIGQTDADYFGQDHARKTLADEQRIMNSGQPILDVEEKEVWPDGRVTWVTTSKFPLRNWRDEIVGTFGISHDITHRKLAEAERRRVEEQLFEAQKMESIGRLAAGVAHEVNTPTQFVTDNVHFLAEAFRQLGSVLAAARVLRARAQLPDHPDLTDVVQAFGGAEAEADLDYLLGEIPRTLDQTLEGLQRVKRIVQSMRELSHPGSPEKAPLDLNRIVQTVVDVSRHEWKHVAVVHTDLEAGLPLVPGVQDEINQVLLNLVVNATHAISDVNAERPGEMGCITLRTRREGSWARIEVEDTGTGVPESARAHLFEPFFTTKSVGRGTGQGLALVRTMIVKRHAGTVGFTTECGKGTTFLVRLPLETTTSAEVAALVPA